MGKYFGTDGFRGEANVDLTVMHAFEIGRYLGWYYGKDKKARVVIGKDTRRSSYMLESALCAGLTASGADAYLLHVTTTPSVSYVARADDFDCGIMISASHNPYYDNGIKLINGKGEKMGDELLDEIEAYIDRASAGERDCLPYATGEKIGRTVDYSAGRNRYIGFLISLATRSYKGKKVGIGGSLCNVFEPVVMQKHFDINYIRSMMYTYGAYGAQMTGSGSAVFGIYDSFEYATVACTMLKDKYSQIFLAKTV